MRNKITVFDYYAGLAMQNAVSEIQEVVPASLWDFIKILLKNLAHMHWLEVRYKEIEGVKEQVAERAFKMAEIMMRERDNYMHIVNGSSPIVSHHNTPPNE